MLMFGNMSTDCQLELWKLLEKLASEGGDGVEWIPPLMMRWGGESSHRVSKFGM